MSLTRQPEQCACRERGPLVVEIRKYEISSVTAVLEAREGKPAMTPLPLTRLCRRITRVSQAFRTVSQPFRSHFAAFRSHFAAISQPFRSHFAAFRSHFARFRSVSQRFADSQRFASVSRVHSCFAQFRTISRPFSREFRSHFAGV